MIQAIPLILSWSVIHLPLLCRQDGEEVSFQK